MIEHINAELLKLQQELVNLDKAVDQINKSGQITKEVLDAAKKMNEDFREQINKIQQMFSDYMNKTYKHTEENINKIFLSFVDRMKEEEEILNKFADLSMQSETLTQEFIKKISQDYDNKINTLITNAEEHLSELRSYFQQQVNLLNKKIVELIDNHNTRLSDEQKILDNYLDLAQATAELSQYLKNVDFPEHLKEIKLRLETIEKENLELKKQNKQLEEKQQQAIELINKLLSDPTDKETLEKVTKLLGDTTNQKILEIVKKIKADTTTLDILQVTNKIKRKSSVTNLMVIILLIIVVLFVAGITGIFFYLFPDFFSTVFGG